MRNRKESLSTYFKNSKKVNTNIFTTKGLDNIRKYIDNFKIERLIEKGYKGSEKELKKIERINFRTNMVEIVKGLLLNREEYK